MNVKKTALYELHKKNNAKFVEFAGYSMPIQYSEGIVKEHNTTRNKSGIFDVSHMGQLFIKYSDDITDKLQEILPTDLKNLKLQFFIVILITAQLSLKMVKKLKARQIEQ